MKWLLKELFFRLVRSGPLPPDRATILMYHSIADRTDHFNSVSPESFEQHLAHLAHHAVPVISLKELVRRLKEKTPLGGAVAITFDDGFRNNFLNALPLLKKYGYPATVFVITDWIGTTNAKRDLEYMSENEIQEMEESGLIDIEPHTASHPKLAHLAVGDARKEIESSRTYIESLLGKPATLFAYPYGSYNEDTVRIVEECGYDAAVSVEEGTVASGSPRYRLPRNSIDASTTPAQFKGKISTAIDWYTSFKL